MGNVFASGLAPPPLAEPVPSPNMPAEENVPKSSQQNATDQNPGSLEDLHKKCKDVFPTVFDGSKFMVTKALSNHFQISHTLNMTSPNPGYRFGATYVGTNQISPVEAYPILLGDIDPNGNLNANIFHQYKNIRGKFAAQRSDDTSPVTVTETDVTPFKTVQDNKFVGTQVTTDYRGSNYTASATFANVDLLNHSGVAVLQYLQNVTPSIAVGTEMAYQYGPQVPGGEIALMSLAARYTGANYTVSGSVGAASIHACFWRKHNENIQVGVEAETNLRLGESVCTVGYQVDLPKANMVFRGMVDTTWNVGAVLEKKLHPLPFTLALSGMINHTNGQHKFGIGLIIG